MPKIAVAIKLFFRYCSHLFWIINQCLQFKSLLYCKYSTRMGSKFGSCYPND